MMSSKQSYHMQLQALVRTTGLQKKMYLNTGKEAP